MALARNLHSTAPKIKREKMRTVSFLAFLVTILLRTRLVRKMEDANTLSFVENLTGVVIHLNGFRSLWSTSRQFTPTQGEPTGD